MLKKGPNEPECCWFDDVALAGRSEAKGAGQGKIAWASGFCPKREIRHGEQSLPIAIHSVRPGCQVRAERRQTMPSCSMESCALLRWISPSLALGQMKRPRSSRLANRHKLLPSHQSSLTRFACSRQASTSCSAVTVMSPQTRTPVWPRMISMYPDAEAAAFFGLGFIAPGSANTGRYRGWACQTLFSASALMQ